MAGAMISIQRLFFSFFKTLAVFFVLTVFMGASALNAQELGQGDAAPSRFFKVEQVRAADASVLVSGKNKIHLWGVQSIDYMPAAFQLRARTSLDNAVGGGKVECERKSKSGDDIIAQCVNRNDEDLALYMIQTGYVSVNRVHVYGTVFEKAYIDAEIKAQNQGAGIWAGPRSAGGSASQSSSNMMLSFSFILFIFIIAAFSALSVIIMRGFQKVMQAQRESLDFMARERKLREKERRIVASMLDSELKANKTKIEAYLIVYDEMLKSMSDPDRPPKYQKTGDIIQKQPVLGRMVFDRNTDKLDMLGAELASKLIHFYARIKSNPEYENLEPDMNLEQARQSLESVIQGAQRMNETVEELLNDFNDIGLSAAMSA